MTILGMSIFLRKIEDFRELYLTWFRCSIFWCGKNAKEREYQERKSNPATVFNTYLQVKQVEDLSCKSHNATDEAIFVLFVYFLFYFCALNQSEYHENLSTRSEQVNRFILWIFP